MKSSMLLLLTLFVLASCSQEQSNHQIEYDTQKIKSDPVFINYIKAVNAQARLTTESETLDVRKYVDIIRTKNTANHVCDIDHTIFDGDKEMEQLADMYCQTSIAVRALHDRYPFIEEMSEAEKLTFFKDIGVKLNYDMEARKRKGIKMYELQEQNK